MNLQMVFGLVVSAICLICGTILLYKHMEIKAKQEKDARAAIRQSNDKIISDSFRLLYEDEYAKRADAEFRLKVTQKELKRARELLSKVKVSEVQ